MPLTANRLTDQEKRTVLKMRADGEMYKTIAITIGKTIPQLASFITWHKGRNNDKYITGTVCTVHSNWQRNATNKPS